MADEIYRQRKRIAPEELNQDPLSQVKDMQKAVARETGRDIPQTLEPAPFQITGNMPPELRQKLAEKSQPMARPQPIPQPAPQMQSYQEEDNFEVFEAPPERPRRNQKPPAGGDQFASIIAQLEGMHQWEEFRFPSRSRFYQNIPEKIHIRAMTGEEEQILATPRFVKRGQAIDMIFHRCIQEKIPTEELLSVDRTHLLIYLRGISYTPEYDVEIKCPACATKFSTVVNLDLDVEFCPDDFGPENLEGVLPTTGFHYRYRFATGSDEQEISNYRERRIQQWGDQSEDDTLLYRVALLLEEIQGVTLKKELAHILKKLPINDVSHLRNIINNPPFGVDTRIKMLCPNCTEEFQAALPLEAGFFFPRNREEKSQV